MGGIKKRMEAVSNALMKMSEKQFLNDIVFPKRKPFSMGGAAPGRGTSVGRGGLGSGGNKGNKGDRRGVKSMRDSGMVSTSTGYGPAGAGGMAQGPSGNQGNQQGNQPDTTEDTTTVETFTPTYEKEDDDDTSLVKELKEKYTFDLFGETYVGYKSPESGFNVGVTGGLNSVGVGVGISFKKGGLLDRSSKK